MCGIYSVFLKSKSYSKQQFVNDFDKIKHRGPDNTTTMYLHDDKYMFGFHRLSINDLSDSGNQPFILNDVILLCNGEIYNYKQLCSTYDIQLQSNSDCEVIIYLYRKFGIQKTIELLHGVFAFCLYDIKSDTIYAVRDRIGVRPLFYQIDEDLNFSICSEAKSMTNLNISETKQLPYGQYIELANSTCTFNSYFEFEPLNHTMLEGNISKDIYKKLYDATQMRLVSDRPIACLLSGGLDSSVISSILSDIYQKSGMQIHTFTIGFKDSTDVKNASIVAKHINSIHHEYIITPEFALSKIPEVLRMIESYDVTTVRASTMMYLICEYISKNFDFKVLFSGEGADELLGGYMYFHHSPNDAEFEKETFRITKELQYFDVLRADRCTSAHGVELRVPFLDQDFLKYCHTIPGKYRKPQLMDGQYVEKFYLRQAFQHMLPNEIVWRPKEALSDGISGCDKSWFEYIKEWVDNYFTTTFKSFDFSKCKDIWNLPCFKNLETFYYYLEYSKYYNHLPIPHYWMPRWVNVNDPSARVLSVFQNKLKKTHTLHKNE